MTSPSQDTGPGIHFIWPHAGLAICGADVKHGAGPVTYVATETTCRECLIRIADSGEWPGAADKLRILYPGVTETAQAEPSADMQAFTAAGHAISLDDMVPRRDPDAEREIAEFLDGVPKDPAAIMAAFDELRTVEEAELAANGIRPVSVVHGEIESYEDEALISGLHALAEQAGQYQRWRGGHGYTTWFFDGQDAYQAAVRFMTAVTAIARPGWVVTPTAQPRFDR